MLAVAAMTLTSMHVTADLHSPRQTRATWLLATITAGLVIVWLGIILVDDRLRFVVVAPRAKTGFEVSLALGQLFGALALTLFPDEPARRRLRWVAAGLLTLGLGTFGYGYLYPLLANSSALNTSMYGSLLVRSLSTILLVIGLLPARPPRLGLPLLVAVLGGGALVGMAVVIGGDHLPRLAEVTDLEAVATDSVGTLQGLTRWHWGLALLPLTCGSAAAVGAARHFPGRAPNGWLVLALVLFAGAQLHTMFWPSAFSSLLTTASLLRLGFTVAVVVGGIFELRRLVMERTVLLAEEQERIRRLEELAALKADFTAIVAHELASPLAAVDALAEVLAIDDLPPTEKDGVVRGIQAEVRVLHTLVADVEAAAAIEREDFAVQRRPILVDLLLADAAAYARTLPGNHPLTVPEPIGARVLADPERIGQVLRNLLNNAAKHTPLGTPISVLATRLDGQVRIEVADRGPGIDPADLPRIFEKYGRGRDRSGRQVSGRGLGLYLSRRILQLHGTELKVVSTPGHGACFSFTLEESR